MLHAFHRVLCNKVIKIVSPPDVVRWVKKPILTKYEMVLIIPTISERFTSSEFVDVFGAVADQIKKLSVTEKINILTLVGVQYPPEEEIHQSIYQDFVFQNEGMDMAIFEIPYRRKIISINTALKLSRSLQAKYLCVADDDIMYERDCFPHLFQAFKKVNFTGVMGIRLKNINKKMQPLYSWLRANAKPSVQFAQGAYLFSLKEGPKEIPSNIFSDDGYMHFFFTEKDKHKPFEKIRLCQNAVGIHTEQLSTNRFFKLRRMMLNNQVLLTLFPREISQFYFKRVIFENFWPLGKTNARNWKIIPAWISKLFIMLLYSSVFLELVVRALINRPITEINWGNFEKHGR